MSQVRSIFALLLCANDPMSIYYLPPFLASFSGISKDARTASRRIIRRLVLLFHGIPHHNVPMPPLHVSFVAFLADSKCSGPFSINMQVAHEEMVRACFEIMETLRFNICSFPSSFTANGCITNLDSIVREAIPSQLSYACRHWTYHASQLKGRQNRAAASISRFFQNHLLHWLEVMSACDDSPFKALVLLRPFQVFTLPHYMRPKSLTTLFRSTEITRSLFPQSTMQFGSLTFLRSPYLRAFPIST
jgi:hypothetical protein